MCNARECTKIYIEMYGKGLKDKMYLSEKRELRMGDDVYMCICVTMVERIDVKNWLVMMMEE